MKRMRITAATLLAAVALTLSAQAKDTPRFKPVVSIDGSLSVDVWLDRPEASPYDVGDKVGVYFHATQDCYVTIYNIDTDGNVNILFPEYPDDGFVYGGTTYRLNDYYGRDYRVRGPRGVEYIHAVATHTPNAFLYRPHMKRYHLGLDPVSGDPFLAMNSINGRIIRTRHINATATTHFFVEGLVWYPRYVCRSCHGSRAHFDPYFDPCPRYSVVVAHNYDYWWQHDYHPVRASFSFGGPFWRFEVRTGPAFRHKPVRYVNVAWGYHNYYCPTPPRTRYVYVERKTPRTVIYRERERNYTPVTYTETRSRTRESSYRRPDDTRSRSSAPDVRTDTRSRTRDNSYNTPENIRSRSSSPNTRTQPTDVNSRTRESATSRSRDASQPSEIRTVPPSTRTQTPNSVTRQSPSVERNNEVNSRERSTDVQRSSTNSRERTSVTPQSPTVERRDDDRNREQRSTIERNATPPANRYEQQRTAPVERTAPARNDNEEVRSRPTPGGMMNSRPEPAPSTPPQRTERRSAPEYNTPPPQQPSRMEQQRPAPVERATPAPSAPTPPPRERATAPAPPPRERATAPSRSTDEGRTRSSSPQSRTR